jgi:hypothetical protein
VVRTLTLAIGFVVALSSVAFADGERDPRFGLSVWGLSYHFDRAIDYDEANVGLGLRYYFNRYVFVEGDALRNSNRGLVLPVSAGLELRVGSLWGACTVSAMGAATIAYYQNLRTGTDYFKVGPVPGVVFGCGRLRTNIVAILSRSRQQPLAAIAASLTIAVSQR